MPCFEAHQPAPPSSSPPVGESSFVTCQVSKLTNSLLPLPPLQLVSPHFSPSTFRTSTTCSSLSIPLICMSSFIPYSISIFFNLFLFFLIFCVIVYSLLIFF